MSSGKILVLEADPALRYSRIRTLTKEGYDVTEVSTVEEATSIAKQEPHELLVISIEKPELLNMLLAQFPPAMGILIISPREIADTVAEHSGAGILSFLIRPFTAGRFKNSVKQTLNRIRLVRDSIRNETLTQLEKLNYGPAIETETDEILKQVLEISAAGTNADYVSLVTKDKQSSKPAVKAQLGNYNPDWDVLQQRLSKISKPLLLTEDTGKHSRLVRLMSDAGISSLIYIPMITGEYNFGTITHIRVKNREQFAREDFRFASILGRWSSLAIENTQLYTDYQKKRRYAEKLLDEISLAQENERKRVAIDIHDGVAQWLVGASYNIKLCSKLVSESRYDDLEETLDKVKTVLQRSVMELRRAIANLPLPPLEEIGLVGTIRKSAEMLDEEGIRCRIKAPRVLPELTYAQEKTFYWIIQESLTNIRRHSRASDVNLNIKHADNMLSICINDNGVGFDFDQVMNSNVPLGHIGLRGMKERAELLDGYLEINSKPGKGTSINLSFSLLPPEEVARVRA